MGIAAKIYVYLNPLKRLGKKKYSILFPLFANLLLFVASEVYAYGVIKNPMVVGSYIIFINVAFIIYFSFRDGIIGGFFSTILTISYYLYIIYTRQYRGQELTSGEDTIIILGLLYFLIAGVIGSLKQTIDNLIEREANQRRRLQQILQQLPVGVMITDKHGVVEESNKQLENILGIDTPVGTISGKEMIVPTFYHNKQISPSQSPVMHTLLTGRSILGREFTIERPDGKHANIKVSVSPIRNSMGKIIAAASIITDVTQEREIETRKDDFVNMASHELKTPVTSMKIYVDIFIKNSKKYKDATLLKTANRIKVQTDKLQELVNDLLDMSRLQTGKLSFRKEKFELAAFVEETIDELKETTSNHTIHFEKKNSASVYADKFRIYQVITNLLTNAIKYSPSGRIEVKIFKQKHSITVSVKDFGIGIAKSQQKKIFEKLYQVSEPREKTFPGFGMGLYISREIIMRHKGKIWVESDKGKGSTFSFALPTIK